MCTISMNKKMIQAVQSKKNIMLNNCIASAYKHKAQSMHCKFIGWSESRRVATIEAPTQLPQ